MHARIVIGGPARFGAVHGIMQQRIVAQIGHMRAPAITVAITVITMRRRAGPVVGGAGVAGARLRRPGVAAKQPPHQIGGIAEFPHDRAGLTGNGAKTGHRRAERPHEIVDPVRHAGGIRLDLLQKAGAGGAGLRRGIAHGLGAQMRGPARVQQFACPRPLAHRLAFLRGQVGKAGCDTAARARAVLIPG